MRRIASSLIMALLLFGLFAFAFTVQPTKAQSETIYISADGSITPSTAPIQRNGSYYTLTGDITSDATGIIIEKSNVTIDGAGYTIKGTGYGTGIGVGGAFNVTIKNTNINNFAYGIEPQSSSNNTISGNNITNNGYGITLDPSSNYNTISGNKITANLPFSYGIDLHYSSNNKIFRNNITTNQYAIELYSLSSNNTISENAFVGGGLTVSDSFGNVVINNIVNGKPLIYLEGASDQTVTEAGQVILINCKRIQVKSLNLSYTTVGLELWKTNNTLISDNIMTANARYDVWLHFSLNNSISQNNLTSTFIGIHLESSSNFNILSENRLINNSIGISLDSSSNFNIVSGNSLINNEEGIGLDSCSNNTLSGNAIIANSDCGITLYYSSQTVVSGNDIAANTNVGILLYHSFNNTISGNNITNSGDGIWFSSSSSNDHFFHNNFINNHKQVFSSGPMNVWDDDYPSGGNYWSDYRARYPNAVENDSSAIWNTPYVIDANNTDRYPLVAPFKSFNVAWNNQTYPVDTVSNSSISNLNFNATAKTLTFNVTGASDTMGFCRVTIPKAFMWCETSAEWMVRVNGTLIGDRAILNDTSNTYIYFTYPHSTETVTIQSTGAVPELQPLILMPLFMIITIFGALIIKRKRRDTIQN